MGFNKRIVTKDKILLQQTFLDLSNLLKADALILDNWSSNFLKKYDYNFEKYQKNRNKIIFDHRMMSTWVDVSSINSSYIGNVLINLKTNPDWVDCQLCINELNLKIPANIAGRFKELCDFCIQNIENEFNK